MNRARGGQGVGNPTFHGLGNDQYTRGSNIFKSVNPVNVLVVFSTDCFDLSRSSYEREIPTPDLEITNKEDGNIRLANGKTSKRDLELPLRPGYGKKEFTMRTNYFLVNLNTNKDLFKYNVEIEPVPNSSARALKNGRKRRQLYKTLFEDHPDFQALGQGIATDYANTLITCGRLFDKSLVSQEYLQVYRSEFEQASNQTSTTQANEQRYKVTVEYTSVVSSSELIKYINSRPDDPSDFSTRSPVIQTMNIIVAGSPNKNQAMFQAGQNKFFQHPRNSGDQLFRAMYSNHDLTGGLIAVRGYYSSVRTSTSRVLLNLNAQCSAFYPEINLLELMHVFAGKQIPQVRYPDLEEFIQRLRIRTVQRTREGKTVTREKTIKGFSHKYKPILDKNGKQLLNPDGSPKMRRTKGAAEDYENSGSITINADSPPERLSVSKYFLRQYGKALDHPEVLVINCGTDEDPKWIPPERCFVMPGQPYRGTLSDTQTTNMHTVAARGPAENARRINGDGLEVIGVTPRSQTLASFGITINPKMVSVHARLLPVPEIQHYKTSADPRFSEWNMRDKKFFNHVPIAKWSWLRLGNAKVSDEAWNTFSAVLKDCGMGEVSPDPFNGFDARLDGYGDDDKNDEAIDKAVRKAKDNGIKILWVILPEKSAAIYSRVKYWADIKHGIHTVCALKGKLKIDKMYYANVAHKFNLKLGGVNHKVSEEALGILEKETMVVGIDVTHPSPGSMENAPSIVGMVASNDRHYGQWPGGLKIQASKQEILKLRKEDLRNKKPPSIEGKEEVVDNIADMMKDRLRVYIHKNGRLPENILIYRDGVSEGQYPAVLDLELTPIREMCKAIYKIQKTEPPKITIVIVGKRHHTRFYPTNSKYIDTVHFASKADKEKKIPLSNPRNVTVVDRGITMLKGWDFYLPSHAAIKGTVRIALPPFVEEHHTTDNQARPAHYVVIHDGIGLTGDELEQVTHTLCYQYQIATKAVSIVSPAYYADILCERGRCYLAKYVSMRGKPPGTRFNFQAADLPWRHGIHDDLKGSMYYI